MESANELIKVAFVDDHISMLAPLARHIEEYGKVKFILLAKSGAELMDRLVPGQLPDVLILDVHLEDMDGFRIVKRLSKEHPSIRIVVFSVLQSEMAMVRLFRLGAVGFVNKGEEPKVLADAIEDTMKEGGYGVTTASARLLVKFIGNDDFELQKFGLSPGDKELQFVQLANSELTYVQIADIMGFSPGVLEKLRKNVFEKFHVNTRVGLIKFAIRHGIISPGYEERDSFSFLY